MSASRRAFEEAFAREKGVTVEDLGRRGWYSYLDGGTWCDICAPDELPAEKRRALFVGLLAVARFGETPPTNGAGAAGGC